MLLIPLVMVLLLKLARVLYPNPKAALTIPLLLLVVMALTMPILPRVNLRSESFVRDPIKSELVLTE